MSFEIVSVRRRTAIPRVLTSIYHIRVHQTPRPSLALRVVPPRCHDCFAFIADLGASTRMTRHRQSAAMRLAQRRAGPPYGLGRTSSTTKASSREQLKGHGPATNHIGWRTAVAGIHNPDSHPPVREG